MESIKNLQSPVGQWGYIVVDENGFVIDASPDFCRHFSFIRTELLGISLAQVIEGTSKNLTPPTEHQQVIFGVIKDHSCFIRVDRQDNHIFYSIILRQEEINIYELNSFMKTIEKSKFQKKSSKGNRYSFEDIIGESPLMNQIKELAARIGTSNSTVLLTGESGTGKELFAQAIHGLSSRKNHPFVAVNCAAIPDELFESEVFGYEAGAFSGAKKEGKPGKIELAHNGTLFLDEISELPYQAQGKLLRVLQEREVERLGGTGSKNVDIRIITATNRDLKMLVQEGKFRQDLFYRLYVFELKIPSLRQRKSDILPLAYHFINELNEKLVLNVSYLTPELQEWLVSYQWPGNVRELKAFIERGMNIVEGDTLTLEGSFLISAYEAADQKTDLEEITIPISLEEAVSQAEIAAIKQALKVSDGDRTRAAQILNIHLASLYRKIAKYKLK
ncbi:sigma-54 interaction domain-containing protein [Neobacillus soli]|uniref:sigma-54 interaction domain-containing protein n=1 Tax=Neobacillus soli TaxID=220688 RepID=UPI000826A2C8|nr:sigma 54-interacting transcriptional regulator [Neobacillus soli]